MVLEELVGGAGCVGGNKKEWEGYLPDDLRVFGNNTDEWTTTAQNEREWRETQTKGRNVSW